MSSTKLPSNVVEIASEKQFKEQSAATDGLLVLYFWASWHPPCAQMAQVLNEVAKDTPSVRFMKVEAESLPEVTEQYPVKSVPTFIFARNGRVVDSLEGADAPQLVALTAKHARAASTTATATTTTATATTATATATATTASAPTPAAAAPAEETKEQLDLRLSKLVQASPVMLFMKGTPDAPKCKFSRELVELLKACNVLFGHFDILQDTAVREGLKVYSSWKTYPQLYIAGKLVGGLDVIKELQAEGSLVPMFPTAATQPATTTTTSAIATATATIATATAPAAAAAASSGSDTNQLNTRLKALIGSQRVMLFMKGTADAPQCGFSAKAVQLLRSVGFSFGTFDILSDADVRQGLKTYSNWNTYPQLYVDSKLIGGLDVMNEMHEAGEFAPLAKSA